MEDRAQAKAIRQGVLTYLYIDGKSYEGRHTREALTETRSITAFHFNQTRIPRNDFDVSILSKHPLEYLRLNLTYDTNVSFPSLVALLRTVTTLRHLYVDDNFGVDDSPYYDVLRNNQELRTVKISSIYEDEMLPILGQLRHLEKLSISRCTDVPGLMNVLSHNPDLRSLRLGCTREVSYVRVILHPELVKLSLIWAPAPTQADFDALLTLISTSKCLESLHVSITHQGVGEDTLTREVFTLSNITRLAQALARNTTLKRIRLPLFAYYSRDFDSVPIFKSMFDTNQTLVYFAFVDSINNYRYSYENLCERNHHNSKVRETSLVQRLLAVVE